MGQWEQYCNQALKKIRESKGHEGHAPVRDEEPLRGLFFVFFSKTFKRKKGYAK